RLPRATAAAPARAAHPPLKGRRIVTLIGSLNGRHTAAQRQTRGSLAATWVVSAAIAVGTFGCKRSEPGADEQEARAKVQVPSGLPIPIEQVAAAVNPKTAAPHAGPSGGVEGTVRVTGDLPPERPELLADIKPECAKARDVYGKLFREGPGRTLADVLVTVTEYEGYVPATAETLTIKPKDCSWGGRTFAVTFGQRLDVLNKDGRGYLPRLAGSSQVAQLVAIPGGAPVKLYPSRPGRYVLADSMRPFLTAEVFALKYATFDVTGLDGGYRIERIPPGEVTLTAFLPATLQTAQKRVKV